VHQRFCSCRRSTNLSSGPKRETRGAREITSRTTKSEVAAAAAAAVSWFPWRRLFRANNSLHSRARRANTLRSLCPTLQDTKASMKNAATTCNFFVSERRSQRMLYVLGRKSYSRRRRKERNCFFSCSSSSSVSKAATTAAAAAAWPRGNAECLIRQRRRRRHPTGTQVLRVSAQSLSLSPSPARFLVHIGREATGHPPAHARSEGRLWWDSGGGGSLLWRRALFSLSLSFFSPL